MRINYIENMLKFLSHQMLISAMKSFHLFSSSSFRFLLSIPVSVFIFACFVRICRIEMLALGAKSCVTINIQHKNQSSS